MMKTVICKLTASDIIQVFLSICCTIQIVWSIAGVSSGTVQSDITTSTISSQSCFTPPDNVCVARSIICYNVKTILITLKGLYVAACVIFPKVSLCISKLILPISPRRFIKPIKPNNINVTIICYCKICIDPIFILFRVIYVISIGEYTGQSC